MQRTDEPIEPSMTVREVRVRFPSSKDVFEQFGIPLACSDCSVTQAAHRARISLSDLLWALNRAALAGQEKVE